MANRSRSFAGPGQILLIRNGVVVGNYGDTRTSEVDYGNGFKQALTASEAGDTIDVGPMVMRMVAASTTTPNLTIIGHNAVVKPTLATNYDFLFRLSGSTDSVIDGLKFDGTLQANTGIGNGLRLENSHRTIVRNVDSSRIYATPSIARGNGVSIYQSNDVSLEDFTSTDVLYAGIQLWDSNRCQILRGRVVDPDDRVLTWYNSSAIDRFEVNGLVGITTKATTSRLPFVNFNGDADLKDCIFKNTNLTAYDHVSAGVLANDSLAREIMKFQNVVRMEFDGCWFDHGVNSGTGYTKTVRLESPLEGEPPEELVIKDSRFAEGFIWGTDEQRVAYCLMENSKFGERGCDDTFGTLLWRPLCTNLISRDCSFNVHQGKTGTGVGIAIEPSTYTAATDRWEFFNPRFKAATNGACYAFSSIGASQLAAGLGNHTFANPAFENSGSGTWYRSSSQNLNLAMTTDKNGDILFDPTIVGTGAGKHPDPGSTAPFFPGVAVPSNGRKIWNIGWPASSPSEIPEKGYVAKDGEWVAMT